MAETPEDWRELAAKQREEWKSMEDVCEGCGMRALGELFHHPGLCHDCNAAIMGVKTEDLWKESFGMSEGIQGELAKQKQKVAEGVFDGYSEDDDSVEVRLKLPPGALSAGNVKSRLHVATTPSSLTVWMRDRAAPLLQADPLAGCARPADTTWFLDGDAVVVALAKAEEGVRWGPYLTKQGADGRDLQLNLH